MNWVEMQVVHIKENEHNQFGYELELKVYDDNETSKWAIVPGGVRGVTLGFVPSEDTTSGVVETTTDLLEKVKADIDGTYLDIFPWTEGDISFCVQTWVTPVTAFRVRRTAGDGSIKLTARAQ